MKKNDNQNENISDDSNSSYSYRHHGNGASAVLLILLGLIFLLNNLDIIPWSIWDNLWRFWPLILILWGLQIMLGRSRLSNFIIPILGLALALFILTILVANINPDFAKWLNMQFPALNTENFRFLIR